MDNYLALIRRADFVDLFKYGSFHLNRDLIRKFTCPVEVLRERKAIFKDLTSFANAFESTFSYLLIHYTKCSGRCNDVHISEVKHIYPLDLEAKRELSQSFDPRIKIEDPLWPDVVLELQIKQSIEGCKNGAYNIWKIYDITGNIEEIESTYITSSVIKEVISELYTSKHPQGEQPIWVYAMRYERHGFYPQKFVGCFMDAIHVIFNYIKQQEIDADAIEGTNIMKFLVRISNSTTSQFDEVLQKINEEPSVSQILKKAKEIEPSLDLIKCLTLFFIYRNRYAEEFRYEEYWAENGKKYGKEFYVAAYMLGCILQHDHTYDCLYEYLPLDIFKTNESPQMGVTSWESVIVESKINKMDTIKGDIEQDIRLVASSSEDPALGELIETRTLATPAESNDLKQKGFQTILFEEEGSLLPEPKKLKKSPKAKQWVTVYTEEELKRYRKQGYKEYGSNSLTAKKKYKPYKK